MSKVYQRGSDRVWEYVFEEYSDCRYELYGIDGNDYDYIRDLEENDPDYLQLEREDFKNKKMTKIQIARLEERLETLEKVMDICQKVSNQTEKF